MNEIRYYKGIHKVKVRTESEGYLIVEALEDFEDSENGQKIFVKTGEQRIVPTKSLHKRKTLPPSVKEHIYELQTEKKPKRLVSGEGNESGKNKEC